MVHLLPWSWFPVGTHWHFSVMNTPYSPICHLALYLFYTLLPCHSVPAWKPSYTYAYLTHTYTSMYHTQKWHMHKYLDIYIEATSIIQTSFNRAFVLLEFHLTHFCPSPSWSLTLRHTRPTETNTYTVKEKKAKCLVSILLE